MQEVDTGTPNPLRGLRYLPGCLQHMLERVPWDATVKITRKLGVMSKRTFKKFLCQCLLQMNQNLHGLGQDSTFKNNLR